MINIKNIQIYSALALASFAIPLHAAGTSENNKKEKKERVLLAFSVKYGRKDIHLGNTEYAYLVNVDTPISKLIKTVLKEDNRIKKGDGNTFDPKTFKDRYQNFRFLVEKNDDEEPEWAQINETNIFVSLQTWWYYNFFDKTVKELVSETEKETGKQIEQSTDSWKDIITNLKNKKNCGFMHVPKEGNKDIEKVSDYKEFSIIVKPKDKPIIGYRVGPKNSGGLVRLDQIPKENEKIFFLVSLISRIREDGEIAYQNLYLEVSPEKELSEYSLEDLSKEYAKLGIKLADISHYSKEYVSKLQKKQLKEINDQKRYHKEKIMIYLKSKYKTNHKHYAYLVDSDTTIREAIKVILREREILEKNISDEKLLSQYKEKYGEWRFPVKTYGYQNITSHKGYPEFLHTKKFTNNIDKYLDKTIFDLVRDTVDQRNKRKIKDEDKIAIGSNRNGEEAYELPMDNVKKYWISNLQVLKKSLDKNGRSPYKFLKVPTLDLKKKIIRLHYKEFSVVAKVNNGQQKEYAHLLIGNEKGNEMYKARLNNTTLAKIPKGITHAYFLSRDANGQDTYKKLELEKKLDEYSFEELETISQKKNVVYTEKLIENEIDEKTSAFISKMQVKIDFQKITGKGKEQKLQDYSIYFDKKRKGNMTLASKVANSQGIKEEKLGKKYDSVEFKAGSILLGAFEQIKNYTEKEIIDLIESKHKNKEEEKRVMFHAVRNGFEHIQFAYVVSVNTTVEDLIKAMINNDKSIPQENKNLQDKELLSKYKNYGFLTSKSLESDAEVLFYEVTADEIEKNYTKPLSELLIGKEQEVLISNKKIDWSQIIDKEHGKKGGAFLNEQNKEFNENIEKVYTDYKELSVLILDRNNQVSKRYLIGSVYDEKRGTCLPKQIAAMKNSPSQHVSSTPNIDKKNIKVMIVGKNKAPTYRSVQLEKDIYLYDTFENLFNELKKKIEKGEEKLYNTSFLQEEDFENALKVALRQYNIFQDTLRQFGEEDKSRPRTGSDVAIDKLEIKEKKVKTNTTKDEDDLPGLRSQQKETFLFRFALKVINDQQRDDDYQSFLIPTDKMSFLQHLSEKKYDLKDIFIMAGDEQKFYRVKLKNNINKYSYEELNNEVKASTGQEIFRITQSNQYDPEAIKIQLHKTVEEENKEEKPEVLDSVEKKLKGDVVKENKGNWKNIIPNIVLASEKEDTPISSDLDTDDEISTEEDEIDQLNTNQDNSQNDVIQEQEVAQDTIENHVLFMFKSKKSKYYHFGMNTPPLEIARKVLNLGEGAEERTIKKNFRKKHYTIKLLTQEESNEVFKSLDQEKSFFEYQSVKDIVNSLEEADVLQLPESELQELISTKFMDDTDKKDSTACSSACKGITISTILLLTVSVVGATFIYYKKDMKEKGRRRPSR